MFSFRLLLQKDISLGLLDKQVLFQQVFADWQSIRYTWQNMFSFSLVLENGISPGILDNACPLSAKRNFTRHTWQSMKGAGKGLGKLKMKHEKGVGCFMVHKREVGRAWEGSKWFPKVLWEPLPTPAVGTMRNTQTPFHASCLAFAPIPLLGTVEHETSKGVWVLHGSQGWGGKGLGRFEKWNMKKGLGASWFPSVGLEGSGKAKIETWKEVWVFPMVP